jgi:hypothetical protein
MSKVILQPCGNKDAREHYVETIKKSVPLTSIKPHISTQEFEMLNDIYPSGECKVWGVTPGKNGVNISKWERIEAGDVTLFSKEGHVFSSAVTTLKLHSKSLASKLWDYNNKGQTWEYIYFLDEVKNHSIPYIDFNRAVGYADNFVIQGFNVLRPEQSTSVLKEFDLESEIFLEEISKETYDDVISKLEALEETEAEIITKRRLEQGYLKRNLFGKKIIGTCAGCKNDYPVSYLITAHIKKRSFCEPNERKDLNVVMPMCKMGCDEIYEKGYICVSNGVFIDMKRLPSSPQLQHYINQISETKCEYYNVQTKVYFDWHFEHNK